MNLLDKILYSILLVDIIVIFGVMLGGMILCM